MEYKVETRLEDFEAWGGGKKTLRLLIARDDCELVELFIEECADLNGGLTEDQINDILWFERDRIADYLGYRDWEAYEEGWSNQDLKNAEEWFLDAESPVLEEISGVKLSDYNGDYEAYEDATREWWDGLSEKEKVETFCNN